MLRPEASEAMTADRIFPWTVYPIGILLKDASGCFVTERLAR
jgi:hypothetical protein